MLREILLFLCLAFFLADAATAAEASVASTELAEAAFAAAVKATATAEAVADSVICLLVFC